MNNNSPASACSIEYKGRDAAFMKRFNLHFTLKPFSRDFEIKMIYFFREPYPSLENRKYVLFDSDNFFYRAHRIISFSVCLTM